MTIKAQEKINLNAQVQVSEKPVHISYNREPGQLPIDINARHNDESGLNVNVHLNLETGKVNCSFGNTTQSASTIATFIQAIRAELNTIITDLETAINAEV